MAKRQEERPWLHCPTCVRQERDLRNGCPSCDLTRDLETLRKWIRTEVLRRWGTPGPYPRWPFGFSVDEALETYSDVRRALNSRGDLGVDPDWDETFAHMAGVVLSEDAQERALDAYERRRK